MTARLVPLHLSKQGILSSLSVEPVDNAAKATLLKPYIEVLFSEPWLMTMLHAAPSTDREKFLVFCVAFY